MAAQTTPRPSPASSRPTTRSTPADPILAEPAIAWQTAALFILGAILGGVAALWIMPTWLPRLLSDIAAQQAPWHLSRAAGVSAFLLLWFSTALGLLITNRLARLWPGGPTAFDLHQFASLLGLAAAGFHAIILLGDDYIGYTLGQLLIPFTAAGYQPVNTGWGQIAFYLALVVSFSFYVRARLGARLWRKIHFLSFIVFALAAAHGLLAGSDTSLLWPLYSLTISSILFLTLYRILITAKNSA